MSLSARLSFALQLNRLAEAQILPRFRKVAVHTKDDGTVVTEADREAERAMRMLIGERYPDDAILGEEWGVSGPERARHRWILDPVDGTEDFVQRVPTFGTIIALHYRGEPVVGVIDVPMLDARVHAAFGLGAFRGTDRLRLADLDPATPPTAVRIMTSLRANFIRHRDDGALFDAVTRAYPNHRIYRSCYTHLCAATGQADAAIDASNPIWDIAAARILVEEAGGLFHVALDYLRGEDRIFTTVFGRPTVVRHLAALLESAGAR